MLSQNRVIITPDPDPWNPRESFDNLGTVFCKHGKYNLGDKNAEDPKGLDKPVLSLPLYLYDHGGITMSTSPFSCPWDSGQVGVIYVTHSDIEEEYGELSKASLGEAKKVLEAEVKEYNHYLLGEVYGFTIEEGTCCESCGHSEWEDIESCFGHIGDDPIENEMICSIESYLLDGAELQAPDYIRSKIEKHLEAKRSKQA